MPIHRPAPHSLALIALLCAGAVAAADKGAEGLSFSHGDWELACDNTRTCRAAGYQSDDDPDALPVSVLLTRAGGAGTPVTGQVQLGEGWDDDPFKGFPARFPLMLRIDGRDLGSVTLAKDALTADLAAAQVKALLASLLRDSRIAFTARDRTWTLSGAGASAVLLKMDEAQGRIGTVGALYRRGKQDETRVPPALPMPVIVSPPLAPARPGDATLAAKRGDAIRAALRKTTDPDDCEGLAQTDEDHALSATRLTKTTLLVSTLCWRAAYNAGNGYWIVDDTPPYAAELVTTDGTDDDGRRIESGQKGRGIGDCWSTDAWTWDGRGFVHSASGGSGQCKGFAGGAWDMPTLVSEVRK
ncbi:MAG: DUF1176 domain-containing protein [Lysobacteraceae bacterium]